MMNCDSQPKQRSRLDLILSLSWGLLCFGIAFAAFADLLRVRFIILVATALLAFAALRTRSVLSVTDRYVAAAFLTGTELAAAAAPALSPSSNAIYQFGGQLVFVLLGWSFALFVLPLQGASDRLCNWLARREIILILVFLAVTELTIVHVLLRGPYVSIIDEVLYRLQAATMWGGRVPRIDPALADFFLVRLSYFRDGYLHGQYPPGWPLVLRLFSSAQATEIAPVFLGCIGLMTTYQLGKEHGGRTTAGLSALILLPSYYFIFAAATYLSHILCLTLVTTAAWLLLRTERLAGRSQMIHSACVGLLLGSAIVVRPMTGVSVGLALYLWILLRHRISNWRCIGNATIALSMVSVPIVSMLPTNYLYSGSYSLVAGYRLSGKGLHDLGLGIRGYLTYHPDGITHESVDVFSFRSAIQPTAAAFDESMVVIPAFSLIGPLLFLWLRRGGGHICALRNCLPFLILPAFQFFYFHTDLRYYTELLPFIALGIATVFADLLRRVPRLCTWLLIFLGSSTVFASGWRLSVDVADFRTGFLPEFQAVEGLLKRYPHVLLFVRASSARTFENLSLFSAERSLDRIVVARDLGKRDDVLIRLYPSYRAFRAVEAAKGVLVVEPLP